MDEYLKIANYFLGEEYEVTPGAGDSTIPGTQILRNDFNKIWPQGFTADATQLTDKEVEGIIPVLAASNDLRMLTGWKNQAEDNLVVLRKLGQTNRIDDMNVRIFLVDKAIQIKNQGAPHLEN